MELVLHRLVHADIQKIMEYYDRTEVPGLADQFYAELRHFLKVAAERPHDFSFRERDLRRVNLRRFPYHFLFRIRRRFRPRSGRSSSPPASTSWAKPPLTLSLNNSPAGR